MPHVLIVDDSPTELHIYSTILQKNGYLVSEAHSGEEAIEKSKQLRPDIILMDVVMPGLNGFQATRQISRNEETKDIPVIILTTKNQDTDRIWGLRQGAKAYLIKPASEKDLIARIKETLSG